MGNAWFWGSAPSIPYFLLAKGFFSIISPILSCSDGRFPVGLKIRVHFNQVDAEFTLSYEGIGELELKQLCFLESTPL